MLARQLFRSSFKDGRPDRTKIAGLLQQVIAEKPRHYLDGLQAYHRLLRLELAKHHAVIETATPLNSASSESIVKHLKQKYGTDLTSEFAVNPSLIGGMRVRVGSNVWDNSVKAQLEVLQEHI